MSAALAEASCARLPAADLWRLGRLRARDDLRVVRSGGRLWLFWDAPDVELAAWLLSLPGVELLRATSSGWRAVGRSLPIFDVPDPQSGKTLAALLCPAAVDPLPPGPTKGRPIDLRLVRDDRPRPTTALLLPLSALVRWADLATSHALAGLSGARCGDVILLRGKLPPLAGERFWGKRVLVPAGWRPEPALEESILAAALHLAGDDLALLTSEGADVLPLAAFTPLTRAGLRLAAEEATHAG